MTVSFDVVVIGAGPAGENVADRVIKAGWLVASVATGLVCPAKHCFDPVRRCEWYSVCRVNARQ